MLNQIHHKNPTQSELSALKLICQLLLIKIPASELDKYHRYLFYSKQGEDPEDFLSSPSNTQVILGFIAFILLELVTLLAYPISILIIIKCLFNLSSILLLLTQLPATIVAVLSTPIVLEILLISMALFGVSLSFNLIFKKYIDNKYYQASQNIIQRLESEPNLEAMKKRINQELSVTQGKELFNLIQQNTMRPPFFKIFEEAFVKSLSEQEDYLDLCENLNITSGFVENFYQQLVESQALENKEIAAYLGDLKERTQSSVEDLPSQRLGEDSPRLLLSKSFPQSSSEASVKDSKENLPPGILPKQKK